jgi:hypothetical protein
MIVLIKQLTNEASMIRKGSQVYTPITYGLKGWRSGVVSKHVGEFDLKITVKCGSSEYMKDRWMVFEHRVEPREVSESRKVFMVWKRAHKKQVKAANPKQSLSISDEAALMSAIVKMPPRFTMTELVSKAGIKTARNRGKIFDWMKTRCRQDSKTTLGLMNKLWMLK